MREIVILIPDPIKSKMWKLMYVSMDAKGPCNTVWNCLIGKAMIEAPKEKVRSTQA